MFERSLSGVLRDPIATQPTCVILKVMHVILHTAADLKFRTHLGASAQRTGQRANPCGGQPNATRPPRAIVLRLGKSRSSSYKTPAKAENVAATVFDKLFSYHRPGANRHHPNHQLPVPTRPPLQSGIPSRATTHWWTRRCSESDGQVPGASTVEALTSINSPPITSGTTCEPSTSLSTSSAFEDASEGHHGARSHRLRPRGVPDRR